MAADTYDPFLGLLLQGTGNNNNTWGALLNSGLATYIAQAISGRSAHAVTGGTLDLSTTTPPAGPSSAMHMVQAFTGTLASDQIVQVPNVSKLWLVDNGCTLGSYTLKFKTPSGSASAAIPVGKCLVICDGADGIFVHLSSALRDSQWLGADGTEAAPSLAFASEPGSGLYRKSAGVLGISIGGSEVAELTATGLNIVAGTITGAGLPTTGDLKPTLKATADATWILWDDGTIGNAVSGATARANADTADLFALLWGLNATNCPVYNSDGSASTRGASAAADFGLNKRIRLPPLCGRALAIAGSGSGLTARNIGDFVGTETHQITQAELPNVTLTTTIAAGQGSHTHTEYHGNEYFIGPASGPSNVALVGTNKSTGAATLPQMTGTTPLGGSGTAHNNLGPRGHVNLMVKL